MEATFDDKAEEVIDALENPGEMTAFTFLAHDSDGNPMSVRAQRPGIGDVDFTLLLGADLNGVSKGLEMHPEDVAKIAIERAQQVDEMDSIGW